MMSDDCDVTGVVGGLVREAGAFMLICLVEALLVYGFGSRALFAWTVPRLAGIVILVCAGSVLATFNASLFCCPRRFRIQFPLEFALFYWTRSCRLGTSPEPALRYLRRARRAAGVTPVGAELDRVITEAMSDDAAAKAMVAGAMRKILIAFSKDRERRLPFRNYWVLPIACGGPISAMVAVIGVVVAPVVPATKPLTVDGLFQALVLFGLTFEGIRLLRIATYKIHDVLANPAFRVVVMSVAADRTLAALADEIYPRISHVVHIIVTTDPREVRSELHSSGKYWFVSDIDGVSDVLEAVAPNSDLVVLDGAHEVLAQKAKAMIDLPQSRYLALNPSGQVPEGYRWIEPIALRASPSTDPDEDPYRLSVLPGTSIWRDRQFQILVFAGLILFAFDGGGWLAAMTWLSAVASRFPNQLGAARRSLISRTTLRAPRAPDFSRRLIPKVLERRVWIVAILLALPGLVLSHPSLEFGVDRAFDLKFGVAACIALFACRALVCGGLFAVKWTIDCNFRILVLRRNTRTYGYGHKAYVMATCGKYGQVISIFDDTLGQTDEDYGEWRESALGAWFSIFAEINSMIRPVTILDTWKRRIGMELDVADFAVFDWIDEITENMQWELRSAAERLPGNRMLIVCSPDREQQMIQAIASCKDVLSVEPHCLVIARGRDDEYIWANHRTFDAAFRAKLHEALAALVEEPRWERRSQHLGAWPYPVLPSSRA
jgi:hypothetical protein